MTDPTDYRARIREALEDAYEGIDCEVDERHDRAVDAVWEIAREATRAVSEEVVRLRLADADQAARDLGIFADEPAYCVVKTYPSWANGWVKCGSAVNRDNGRCFKHGHEQPAGDASAPVPASPVAVEGSEPARQSHDTGKAVHGRQKPLVGDRVIRRHADPERGTVVEGPGDELDYAPDGPVWVAWDRGTGRPLNYEPVELTVVGRAGSDVQGGDR